MLFEYTMLYIAVLSVVGIIIGGVWGLVEHFIYTRLTSGSNDGSFKQKD
jgi:hypothetical protein